MKLLSTTALAAVLLAGGAAADDKGHGGNAPFASPDATWATDFDRSTLRIFRVDARGKRLPHYFRVQLRDLYEVDQSGAVQCSLGGAAAGSPGALPEDGFLSFDSIASSDFTQPDGTTSTSFTARKDVSGPCGNVSVQARFSMVSPYRSGDDDESEPDHSSMPSASATASSTASASGTASVSSSASATASVSGSASTTGAPAQPARLVKLEGRRDGHHSDRPRARGRDAFLVLSLRITGWNFTSPQPHGKLVLDAKVNDNSRVGHAASTRLPRQDAERVPLETYALPYGKDDDSSSVVTYGLLRLWTVADVDGESVAPVAIDRHGRVFRVVLPRHERNVTWGALFQSTAGNATDGSGDSAPAGLPLPPASVPTTTTTTTTTTTNGTGSEGGDSAGMGPTHDNPGVVPLPGDGTVSAGTPTGGEGASNQPLPPATGDTPTPEGATASGASATTVTVGSSLLAVAAGLAVTVLHAAARA